MNQIQDLYTGRRSPVYVVSRTHGQLRAPMIQTMSWAPKTTIDSAGEWGTKHDVIQVTSYENTEVSMEWKESNVPDLIAMFMDVNPYSSVVGWDPEQLHPIDVYVNNVGLNSGGIDGGILLIYGSESAEPQGGDLNTARKTSSSRMFTRERRIKGGAIQYTRFTKGTPAFVTGDDVAFDTNGMGTFQSTTKTYPLADGSSVRVLHAKFNGNPVYPDTSAPYAVDATTFTPTTAPVSGDVWEVYTIK